MRESGGKLVIRHEICKLTLQTLTANNIQAAFKKSGHIPFNAIGVLNSRVAPSTTFKRSCEGRSVKTPVSSSAPMSSPLSTSAEDPLQKMEEKILENVLTGKSRGTP